MFFFASFFLCALTTWGKRVTSDTRAPMHASNPVFFNATRTLNKVFTFQQKHYFYTCLYFEMEVKYFVGVVFLVI